MIAKLLGVDRENISVGSAGKSRKYYKELGLPSKCDFSSAKAKYNNRVLEVIIQKSAKVTANKKIEIN